MDPQEPLIERYMPEYDVRSRYAVVVRAPAAVTYEAALRADLLSSWVVRSLFALRTLPARIGSPPRRAPPRTLGELARGGSLLEERRGEEIALGLIGKFWVMRGRSHRPISAATFRTFDEPGLAKSVIVFRVDAIDAATSFLATETRVRCTDGASRRRFRPYWAVIAPFSGLIRKVWLRAVRDEAERSMLRSGEGSAIRSPRAATEEGEGRARAG